MIRDVAARLVDQFGDFRLAHALFVGEMLVGARFFDRVEVFALDIFDQRNRHHLALIEIADNRRNFMQFGALRRAPAPFAGDQLVAALALKRTDDDGLDDPALRDRAGKIVERFVVENLARLAGQRLDPGHRDGRKSTARCTRAALTLPCSARQRGPAFARRNAFFAMGFAEQRAEPAAQLALCAIRCDVGGGGDFGLAAHAAFLSRGIRPSSSRASAM